MKLMVERESVAFETSGINFALRASCGRPEVKGV